MKALATEMTENFGKRLEAIGLKVRELTGDTTLSKREIAETQMLVLTPEKWDVVTRKDSETSLTRLMRLLIIDEVHLLHDDRGPVIETIVARTLRQVEMSQQGVRIVGLSATLPNYVDVAKFLRVNLYKGLFFFDSRFRPVPLSQTFIGVRKAAGSSAKFASTEMDEVCYEKVHEFARQGHQVLVFVHTRNATAKLATFFRERAAKFGHSEDFRPPNVTTKEYMAAKKAIMSSHNGQLIELFQFGYSIHHAGLPRRNRLAIEKFFASGHIKVLFCTATLAWGINLPAHAVVIRGTEVFNAQKGTFTDIGVLDVQQIFGRAGRPQYENSGHGIIITWHRTVDKYVAMLTRQIPIESQLMAHICDNLNAEIVLGTVSDINEAVEWLSYSYYFIRAKLNPLNYGIPHSQIERDPELREYLTKAVTEAAEKLDRNQMIRFDSLNGYVTATDLGRVASHYYVKYETIEMLNEGIGDVKLTQLMTDDNVLKLIANASEFSQIKVCEGEIEDLEDLLPFCPLRIKQGGLATPSGKINCLLQAYMSRVDIRNFSLLSESLYIYENAGRLCRAIFEIVLRRGWAQATNAFLVMAKCIEKRIWPFQTPLRQIEDLRFDIYDKIERRRLSYNQLFEMPPKELGSLLSCDGQRIYEAIRMLPSMYVDASIKPITNTIIQISLTLLPAFIWNDQLLGARGTQSFWVFVEDINENFIIHFENFFINKRKVQFNEECNMILTIPIRDQQLTHNYQVRVASNYYVVDDSTIAISMHNCVLPSAHRPHTDLLDLDPLPITALKNKIYESVYDFAYFNPIQTQVFYCLYNTDQNALIGAPTGSGKTLCAELAMYRVFTRQPTKKCVYIAPLKALVRERVNDWSETLGRLMRFRTVELTGDHTPDVRSLAAARLVITTPEKWDGITRGWETREYVKDVALVVIDEIHLLGVERGAVLEAIITRLKLMASKQCSDSTPVRIVGLSTALANAGDVAEWLNVKDSGLFNFRPNVRPIPIEVHIAGFPGQQYCPRMALMNRPAFKAIKSYSPHKPVLVFVASRRQTRLTAMAFVSQLVSEDDPRQWLHMDVQELEYLTQTIKDESLKLTLPFGIGMHHAGLQQHERSLVEQLFVDRKIQVLIATATLAWGINMPAHLVIVKGTEYYDGKTHKYVNFPVTDVLQMMGRAGRPQYDDSAVAVIYVQDVKKNFYKRFLYEPFPVESSMLPVLANHVNAEVHAGTITSKHQIMEYIAGTYLYRRLFANPSYYEVVEATSEALTAFLVDVVDTCVDELLQSRCITVDEEDQTISSAPLGRIASVYYLQHETVRFFAATISEHSSVEDLLRALADNPEYGEIPVRHNEDQINAQLQRYLPIKLPTECAMDSSHTKAHLLLQAHLSRTTIPTDYVTDQRSVLDQCVRILQAMFDVSLLSGWLSASLNVVTLLQMIMQARWHTDHPLLVLPHMTEEIIERIAQDATIPLLQNEFGVDGKQNIEVAKKRAVAKILDVTTLDERQANEILSALLQWPIMYPKRCSLTRKEEEIRIELVQDEGRPVFIRVEAGAVYKLRFFVEMIGPNRYQSDAFCPRFPKEKSAGWILLVGEKDSGQLIAYAKTPPVVGSRELRVEVKMPMKRGRQILAVFILSDSYLGIDQEYNLHCDVI
uniref:U5 small nuclear ribonucleoprotein 200 kDa helicase n=2 Tax=Parascaris univalens TaxID=6257 RepID=A0A915CIG8_PARUN